MEERNIVAGPAGWTDLEHGWLQLAIEEEVARQLARLLHDPATLYRIFLLSLAETQGSVVDPDLN